MDQPTAGVPLVGSLEYDADGNLVHAWKAADIDCDGRIAFTDINALIVALQGEAAYYAQYPDCYIENADCNGDGAVDFADVNPFVAILSGGS